MPPSRDAIKELFFAALERSGAERDAFLAASGADPEVVREVRLLLASHDEAGSFLDADNPGTLLTAPALSPGQRLGPYEVVELIGKGGMGEVYSARDTRLGRLVAIKVLPNAFGRDKARQQRFEEEARAASALNHPNVLTVYDVGTVSATDGSAFMVMELLEGQTLRTRLQRGEPLTRGQVIDYAIQIARGLTVAHEAGIVHRDLKPDNLFLTADGRMKILDFGVAKLVRSNDAPAAETQPAETQPGAVIGTAGYMAPEQVRGLPADTRSDIFSFGTVLFELLTWRRAFSGVSPIDTMSAILHADPLERETPRAGRDAALFGVVRRCLAKDPDARFQHASQVVRALEDAGRQHAGLSRAVLVTFAIAAALAVLAVVLWQRREAPSRPAAAAETSEVRTLAVLPFENISADASQQYLANGMTEEISAQLARLSSLRLMSRIAVARYAGQPDATRRIREELGVGALVTGSVRLAGTRARISVQLVDTGTAQAIWSHQYDQTTADILQLQSDVARQIAAALQTTLTYQEQQRLIKQSTSSPAAYELYLKATALRPGPQGIAMLNEAVKLDPKFALAYAALSRMQGELGAFGDRQLYTDALASARKAVEADPNEGRAHHALATMHLRMGNIAEARAGYLRALDLAPNLPEAAWDLSVAESAAGRLDESLFWARRGFVLAPNASMAYFHVAVPLAMLADTEATQRWLRGAEERFPRSSRIQYMLASEEYLSGNLHGADARVRRALAANPKDAELKTVVAVYAFLTDASDAQARVEELFKQSPDASAFGLPVTIRTLYAYQLLKRGDTARASALLEESLAAARKALDAGSDGSEWPLEIAAIHAVRGERDEAVRWVEAAYRAGDRFFRELRLDPFMASLRADPGFTRIVQQMETDVAAIRKRVDVNDNPPLPPLPATAPAPRR